MNADLIWTVRTMTEGVRGNILTYIPRHNAAQCLVDGAKDKIIKLKYVRARKWPYEPNHYIELRPSTLGGNTYGDEDSPIIILRDLLTVGEKVRLRTKSIRKKQNY